MYVILYHFFINSRISTIAFLGHFTTQFPQDKQSASYITAQLSSICIASLGQLLWHRPQPMQLTSQAFLAGAPISRLEQRTRNGSPTLCMWMICCGQAFSHNRQPTQLSRSISATPCALMLTAFFPTGFHTGATADTSILTVVIVFSAVTCHISKLPNSFFHCHCTPFLYCWSAA